MPQATPEARSAYQRAYRKANHQRIIARQRAFWQENREALMEKSRECYKKHRLKRLEKDAARDIADPEGYLLMHAKVRAKRAGREFSLSRGDLCIPQRCPVLGIPLVSGRGKKGTAGQSNNSPTVDRIDNGRGYVPGNVVVISWRANSLKGDASMWELQQLVNFYSLFLPCEPSKREEPTDG